MALNTAQLTIDLTDFLSDLPGTEADCAQAWAEILGDYTALIVPPVPPLAHSAAVLTLQGALLGMAVPGAALGVFQAALAAFAGSLAGAMPPAPPGSNIPPPTPIALPFGGLYVTVADAVSAIAPVIDAWFRTGTSNGILWS